MQLCTKTQETWDLLLSKKDIKKWIIIGRVFKSKTKWVHFLKKNEAINGCYIKIRY